MEIINAHAHIYPMKIAEKATKAIGDFYNLTMNNSCGSAEKLLEKGLKAGVSKFIVHSCATKKEQVRSINEFILNEMNLHKEFIGFMTLHQDLTEEEIIEEIQFCKKNGFKGIKLHPDFQKFYIDDENVEKIYRAIIKTNCNFPILFHTGDNRYDYSSPYRLKKTAEKYKNINFIGAHFGGYQRWDSIEVYKGLDNVFFDTTSSLFFLTKERAEYFINFFGADRFFFGDDFPMWDINDELKRFLSLNLTKEQQKMILSENIKKLLKI